MILFLYVARALLRGFVLTLVILVLLMSLAALVSELDDVGDGRYGMIEALVVVGLRIPERARDLAAISALVGGIIGLGVLATGSELVAMRAAGLSPLRVSVFALGAGLPLAAGVLLLSEAVVPSLSQTAVRQKQAAIRGPGAAVTDEALWIREGEVFIRIGAVRDGDALSDIQVFSWAPDGRLQEVIAAERGEILPEGRWRLHGVERQTLGGGGIARSDVEDLPSPFRAESLRLLVSPIELLPVSKLLAEARAEAAPPRAGELRRLLWRRLSAPLLLLAMLVLAVPFAFIPSGSGRLGRRLALGVLVGVLAHLSTETLAYLAALLHLDPALASLAPVALAASAAALLVARLR